jgi:hypothetical protein
VVQHRRTAGWAIVAAWAIALGPLALCAIAAGSGTAAAGEPASDDSAAAREQHRRCAEAHRQRDVPALRRCSRALEQESPGRLAGEALLWRAELLLDGSGAREASDVELDEAAHVARRAARHLPDDERPWRLACRAALEHDDVARARLSIARLQALAPDDALTTWLEARVLLAEDDVAGADRALERAREQGLAADRYGPLRATIDGHLPRLQQRLTVVGVALWMALAAWLGASLRRRQRARLRG